MVAIEHLFGWCLQAERGCRLNAMCRQARPTKQTSTNTQGHHVNVITQTHRRLDLRPCSSPRLEDVRRVTVIVDVAAGPGIADTRDQGAAGERDLHAALRFSTLEARIEWKEKAICMRH